MIDLSKMVTASQKTQKAKDALLVQENADQRAFLLSTDWLVLRQFETGKPVPADVANARQAARTKVDTSIPK